MADATAAAQVVLQEIRADREAMDGHLATVREALTGVPWSDGSPLLAVVAVAVHHFYGAAESIFERVARTFEGAPERSDRWHQELLERMALSLGGVRPALIRRETPQALAMVLG